MILAIFAVLIVAICLLVFLALRATKDAPDRAELIRLQTREQNFQEASRQLQEQAAVIAQLKAENAALAATLEAEQRNAAEKLKLLQDAENRLKTEFEILANRIFEDKGKLITDQNRERFSGILQPFKEQLESFRKRVDDVHSEDARESAKLIEQVRQLQDLSNKVSADAANLASAIKGEAKTQGNWGELLIKRMLEASGLQEGLGFKKEDGLRDAENKLKKPDFIVYLPENRAVIIDSKVSLTAFERACNADSEKEQESALKEHVKSVKNHVDELEAKDYSALLGGSALDFVIMCIPLEPAYQAALKTNQEVFYDTAKRNVAITGPTTLMITLKLIAHIWRRAKEDRNAQDIAEKAGGIYEQARLIVETMTDAQKKLTNVEDSFNKAMNQLANGKGNLVGRVEKLRKLGAKVNKQILSDIIEQATAEEDEDAMESVG